MSNQQPRKRPLTLCQMIGRLDRAVRHLQERLRPSDQATPEWSDLATVAAALHLYRAYLLQTNKPDLLEQIDAYREEVAKRGEVIDRPEAVARVLEFALGHVNLVEELAGEPVITSEVADPPACSCDQELPVPEHVTITTGPLKQPPPGRPVYVTPPVTNPERCVVLDPELLACEECQAPLLVDRRLLWVKPDPFHLCTKCAECYGVGRSDA